MSKPVLQLAAVGLVGFALWKLGSFFFIPLLVLAVKVALVVENTDHGIDYEAAQHGSLLSIRNTGAARALPGGDLTPG